MGRVYAARQSFGIDGYIVWWYETGCREQRAAVDTTEEGDVNEVFPVVAGVLVGLIALRIANVRLRTFAYVALSVVFGVIATTISGEFAVSWGFLLIDIPLVMLAGVATVAIATYAPRLAEQRR